MKCSFTRRTFHDSTLFFWFLGIKICILYAGDSMKYNYKIDAVKFLCSLAVVLIHLTSFMYYDEIATFTNYYSYRYFLNIAVPFYFATSGYLLAQNAELDYLKNYAKKIFVMYIFFSGLYILFNLGLALFDHFFLGQAVEENIATIIGDLTITNFIKGNIGSFHLWYLSALVLAMLLLMICIKLNLNATLVLIGATVLYSLDLFNTIDLNDITTSGGFPKGFFYLAIGYFISSQDVRIQRALTLFIVSIGLYSISAYLLDTNAVEAFLALSTFFLLIYCKQNPGEESKLSILGKESLKIYIMHVIIYQSSYRLLDFLVLTGYRDSVFDILGMLVICVVLSIVFFRPINKLFKKFNKGIDFIFE